MIQRVNPQTYYKQSYVLVAPTLMRSYISV